MIRFEVLIVGAGHGGAQAAIALRQHGFAGSLALLGDEPELPYERPPLSKEYLSGEKAFERTLIRPAGFWDERNVCLVLNRKVTMVNATEHYVITETGEILHYGTLIWAAGGHARWLPGSEGLTGVHTIRTRADVDRLAAELSFARRVVVIGGGYIGLEAAAVLSKQGKNLVLLEAQDRLLPRVSGEQLSRFLEQEHRAQGVDIRLNTQVAEILGDDRVTGVKLDDGTIITCEMVIIGIGIVPSVDPLLEAGATGGNGVDVDRSCHTSLDDIYAIGDCAKHPNRFAGGQSIRLESVQNANDQATVAARAIVGQEAIYDVVPWFWSNQYDLRLQSVGISTDHDETVIRGDVESRRFSVIYLKDKRIIALDCVNSTKDYVQGRRLVSEEAVVDSGVLSDVASELKDIVISPRPDRQFN